MSTTKRTTLFFFFVTTILISCQPTSEECVVSPDVKIEVNFRSFEDSIASIQTRKQLVGFLTRHADLRDIFFGRGNFPDDSTFINQLFRKFTHPAFDTLLMETKKVFGDGHELKEEFQNAFANLKY